MERNSLRKAMRQQRRMLSPQQRAASATSAALMATQEKLLLTRKHLAFYSPFAGELDPTPLLINALKQGKHCYLPVIDYRNQLRFTRFEAQQPLIPNRYGILEPASKIYIHPNILDIVIVPVVAFNRQGHRLGHGAGHYDRCFAAIKPNSKTKLIGYAYDWQLSNDFAAEPWDVPLYAVITDKKIYYPGA